jgi:hypothetical protein
MIDQIRASKLPSNMMQFAARGALQVPAAENIEILVHLALHNKIFGDLARMTLAGWDEKASRAAAADPQTPREVLEYFVSPDNLRPALVATLLENPSVPQNQLVKLAVSASRETVQSMLQSPRVKSMSGVLDALKGNPYLRKEDVAALAAIAGAKPASDSSAIAGTVPASIVLQSESVPKSDSKSASEVPTPLKIADLLPVAAAGGIVASSEHAPEAGDLQSDDPESEEAVSAYLKDHDAEIAAEGDKPFQSIGGVVELLGREYYPVTQSEDAPAVEAAPEPVVTSAPASGAATAATAAKPQAAAYKKPEAPGTPKRENALQKINRLDVKGRIQLALKGNKEERSLLIRDGTKVVALAVLEAPKLADGEVEKFASQKNVLEAVLRQIPLKRRFMKNYIVVRNLVANPRTPLDLGLSLMKNLMAQDLKNISGNKEISETIRKLALKMYKQKMEESSKK